VGSDPERFWGYVRAKKGCFASIFGDKKSGKILEEVLEDEC
jgi:hypothetical protein